MYVLKIQFLVVNSHVVPFFAINYHLYILYVCFHTQKYAHSFLCMYKYIHTWYTGTNKHSHMHINVHTYLYRKAFPANGSICKAQLIGSCFPKHCNPKDSGKTTSDLKHLGKTSTFEEIVFLSAPLSPKCGCTKFSEPTQLANPLVRYEYTCNK